MEKERQIFTPKDLAYLKDIFDWNITANKKIDYFLKDIKDEQIIELFTSISKMHYDFCQNIINILESSEENNG